MPRPFSRQVHQRFDVPGIDIKRDRQLNSGVVELPGAQVGHAEIVVGLYISRIECNGAAELAKRIDGVPAVLVEEPEIVVDFGARIVLLEQNPVLSEGAVEVAHPLVVERERKMIRCRRRTRD